MTCSFCNNPILEGRRVVWVRGDKGDAVPIHEGSCYEDYLKKNRIKDTAIDFFLIEALVFGLFLVLISIGMFIRRLVI